MLRHIGEMDAADRVERALLAVYASGLRTGDLAGTATTDQFTRAIIERM